ncbi:uncharacterized protein LOC124926437 isoform X2 [Impatiens glandulifera]|uniref:uncharacterized protein LOC124926437 isoform X2 n=1 Tax=Impatiens glandulifera TaxID=253017 RepID=UPI001FB1282B|nr:uncharacterized protein LOC124926437 isoform X2 [Impatiens glandulifera]
MASIQSNIIHVISKTVLTSGETSGGFHKNRSSVLDFPRFQDSKISRQLAWKRQIYTVSRSSNSSEHKEVGLVVGTVGTDDEDHDDEEGQFGYLVREYGWRVRRLDEKDQVELNSVAQVQAQAFHVPVFLFDDFFLQFFQAEVLSALLYRLRNSASNRYACLVAERDQNSPEELVGVVDVTVQRDYTVLEHLPERVNEYLYVSGIAVLSTFRRMKIATALLKGCDILSTVWGFKYLVLRAYEDDIGALKLYTSAGYMIVSGDPPWLTSWIGRKRRVLLVKRTNVVSSF